MSIKQAPMDEGSSVVEMNPTHQPLTIFKPATQNTEIVPPLVDLIEEEDYYLVSVDLPGLPDIGSEIELKKNEIQIIHERPHDSAMSEVLFRCRTKGDRVKVVYYQGALWLLLPKNGRTVRLRGITNLVSSELASGSLEAG